MITTAAGRFHKPTGFTLTLLSVALLTWVLHATPAASSPAAPAAVAAGPVAQGAGAWRTFPSPTEKSLYAVAAAGPELAYAVGQDGLILRFDGTEWQAETSPVTASLRSIALVPGSLPVEGWAVGNQGTILHLADERWTIEKQDADLNIHDITISLLDGVALAVASRFEGAAAQAVTMDRVSDGTWFENPAHFNDETIKLNGIAAIHSQMNWIQVGAYPMFNPRASLVIGKVCEKPSPGSFLVACRGNRESSDPGDTLQAVTQLGDTEIATTWIVGNSGHVEFRTRESKSEQNRQGSAMQYHPQYDQASNLLDVDSVISGEAWIVGERVLLYCDSKACRKQAIPKDIVRLNGIDMLDAHGGWAVGSQGRILRYRHAPGIFLPLAWSGRP